MIRNLVFNYFTGTVILVCDEGTGGRQEHFHELGHFADNAESAQGRLLAQISVGRLEKPFHLRGQIARHFWGGD